MARCSGHPNVGNYLGVYFVSGRALDALSIGVSAGIIKLVMQCSIKLDDLRLKKPS